MKQLFISLASILVLVAIHVHAQDFGNSSASFDNDSSGNTSIDDAISLYTLPSATNRSYLVGLRTTPDGPNICLGALINHRFVLSSHCMLKVDKKIPDTTGFIDTLKSSSYNILYASIGNRYRLGTKYGEVIPILSWRRHEKYNTKTGAFNLILFQLNWPSVYKSIPLSANDNTNMDEGINVTTMGWTSSGATPFLTLVDGNFYGQTPCAERLMNQDRSVLDDSNVCAMGKKRGVHDPERSSLYNTGACYLMHGSPLIMIQGGEEVLVGLLNFSIGCRFPHYPSVFSRLTHKQYHWVRKHVFLE